HHPAHEVRGGRRIHGPEQLALEQPVLLEDVGAPFTVLEMGERPLLTIVEVQGEALGLGATGRAHVATSSCAIMRRSFSRARKSRAMMVPGATPMMSAISRVVRRCT